MKKKICSFVLIIAMLAMFLPSGLVGTTVYADSFITSANDTNGSYYTSRSGLAEKLNQVFSGDVGLYSNSSLTNVFKAPLGSSKMTSSNQCWIRSNTTGNTLSGWQCYIYANAVYNTLFNEWVGHGGSYSHSRNVISGGSSVSYSQFVNAGVRCGAYIRTTSNSDGSYNGNAGHSLIVLSYDSSNLTCLEGNADSNGLVRISTRSWSSFNSVHLTNRSRYICHIVQPTDSYYDNLYPDVLAPTQATININDTKFEIGETVILTFSANNNPTGFGIGIDKDGSRVITSDAITPDVNNTYSISSLDAGSYSAFVTAWNSAGYCNSNRVSFTVLGNYNFEPTASVTDNGHVYTLYDDRVTWKQAKAKCEELGGNLVTINSEHEQEIVNELRVKGKCQEYWIGLTDEESEGSFKWVTGEAFSYSNWSNGQPDNSSNVEHYVHMWAGGEWNDIAVEGGGRKIGFILEKDKTYTIKYDARYGENAPENQIKTHDVDITLSQEKPTRNGHEFLGWAKNVLMANGGYVAYMPGARYSDNADLKLYAVWKKISSIEMESEPNKVVYNIGDTLDTSGMKLTVTYDDDTTKEITSEFTCSPTLLDNVGTQTITVDYNGKTTTFNVTVEDQSLNSITISSLPEKLVYEYGEHLDTTGMKVIGNFKDGSSKDITNEVTCTPVSLFTPGTQEIKVSYHEKTVSFNVTVNDIGIEIVNMPNKLVYNVGDTLDTDGLILNYTYNDGPPDDIYEGFTCTPTVLNSAGTQEITVEYEGKTTTFNVTVNRVLTSVTVKTNPDKLVYTMGDTLDLIGLVLTASYNDGYTEDIASGFTCTPTELNTVGTQEITVEYEGKTTTFNVTVNKIVTSVFVMANPNKTTYSAGDTLDTTGMKLLVVYHDGTTKTITEGFTCTPADLTTVGTQEITVEYGGKTATFEVTVKEAYSLKASPESEQTIGEPVVLTATGGSSYRFYYEQNGKWVNIRNFSTENACLWIPTVPRDYTIYVDIKDESGKVVTSKRIEYTVTDAYPFTLDKEGEQNVGVNMTLTAKGGSSYKFYYEYNGAWCNITSNTTGICEWSPKYAGSYMLYVDIKDESGKVIACRTQAFKLNDPFSLTSDAQSNEFPYGNTINFIAVGGTSYKFYYEKQGEWQRVQDFSSKNTCAWTPTEAGKYNFYCDIKDTSGKVVSCKRMTFTITNPYSFTADKETTQPVGTEIGFTATGGYQYKFYYEKDGSWVRIQSFSTANTCSWTPTVAGRYNVYCDIADENGTVLAYKGIEFVIGNAGTTDYTFITSVESPQPMNTSVILSATGGASYKFYYEVGGKWATVQNFSTANTATWTPDMIADYTLYVDIKNSSGKVVKTISKKFSATDPYSFTADTTSPQNIGKSVKLTATGGASYKFYYQYSGAWVKIQDSTSATCNWKPNKAGEYMVYVDIKNASGAVVTCRTMKLVFNDPYRFTTSASSLTQPVGTAISFSANGGASYKFYYEKDGTWVRIQDYSTTKTCTWTPTEAGKYNVFCDIKDARGSVAVCKRITFNITDRITITSSKTNASVGDTITFTATGGASYKFYYEKDGAWVRIQSFSENNTCNWTPTAEGDYVVYVDVNDQSGNLIGCKGVRCVVG